jgi:outer membrane protein assembly factor BamB/tetratricopeptide (TPR) repeat protein
MAQRDIAGILKGCDQFFCSNAALDGMNLAAELYFERGEFVAAGRAWQKLANHPRASTQQKAEFLHHAAIAARLSGRDELAKSLRDKIEADYEETVGIVNGKEVVLLKSVDEMLAKPAWETVVAAVDEWPQLGGSASRNVTPDVNSTAGARLWSMSFDEAAANANQPPQPMPFRSRGRIVGGADPSMPMLTSYPILSGGTLLIHTGDKIAALSANAGNPLWQYPPADKFVSRDARGMEQRIASDYNQSMRFSFVDAAAAFENNVYAVLPATNTGTRNYYGGYNLYYPTRLVALNRMDGSEAWPAPVNASDVKVAQTTQNASQQPLMFVGAPVVTRQGVFVVARKSDNSFMQYYLVRVDRATGQISWACYICSNGTIGYGPPAGANRVPIPTVADDVVYVSTGQGADAAIDANAGRILWLQITENAKVKQDVSRVYQYNIEMNPSWKFNPPMIWKDKVVTYEIGGFVRIYDRATGKLLWKKDRKDLGNVEVLAGFHGDELITIGTGDNAGPEESTRPIRAIDMKTFKETWSMDSRTNSDMGKIQGRPFLAQKVMYVPFSRGLLMIDLEKKKVQDFSDWPKGDIQPDGKIPEGKAGNMLVTSEQVIVVSDREVAGYSRWESALANRLARIKAAPNDPEPYLSLAEISFRTNHYDLAEENLSQAVKLIVEGKEAPEGFRQRIYRTAFGFAEQLLVRSDVAQRARARFYYEQCKQVAYSPDTQAEWRLSMSLLSVIEQKWPEAAQLYNAVLNDPTMRGAQYRRENSVARAGTTAEQKMKELIDRLGKQQVGANSNEPDYEAAVDAAGREAVYKPIEVLAETALQKARSEQGDTKFAALAAVMDSYPNSRAAIASAGELAKTSTAAGKPLEAISSLQWLVVHSRGAATAQIIADLAVNHAALNRWNIAMGYADRGVRVHPTVAVSAYGAQTTFGQLRDTLRSRMPANLEGRRPMMPMPRKLKSDKPDDESVTEMLIMEDQVTPGPDAAPPKDGKPGELFFTKGNLLAPIEQASIYRKPDAFFGYANGALRMFKAPNFKAAWASELSVTPEGEESGPPITLHLGSYGDTSLFVQPGRVLGVNTAKGKLQYEIPLMFGQERQRIADTLQKRNAMLVQEANRLGAMVYNPRTGTYSAPGMSDEARAADPDVGRNIIFDERFGGSTNYQFTTMRMIGSSLVVINGYSMTAYDTDSGTPIWKERNTVQLPDGAPIAMVGNEDVIVTHSENENGNPIFRIFDAGTGKNGGDIKLDNERALWRGLSGDGILYVVTDQNIYGYDCMAILKGTAGTKPPLWQRNDIRVRWAGASAITMDGLVVVNDRNEIICLTPEEGQNRWPTGNSPAARVNLPANSNQGMGWTYLRSYVDGEQIIYQSQTGCEAYYTADCSKSWVSTTRFGELGAGGRPPLFPLQWGGPYIIAPAGSGQSGGGGYMTALIVAFDGRPNKGSVRYKQELTRPGADANDARKDPPPITPSRWQVVDNAIVMEIQNRTYLFKAAAEPATNDKTQQDKK